MKRATEMLKEIFPIYEVYQYMMPTYASGQWYFGFASKKYDPIKDLNADAWNELGLETNYYNTELHVGCFALPTYVKKQLTIDNSKKIL